MLDATFTFSASQQPADDILFHVREMSGVTATLGGTDPFTITAQVTAPFDASRLDNVENVIRGLAPDVARV